MAEDAEGLIQPNDEVLALAERAKQAHGHLRKSWQYWRDIGTFISAFKNQLIAEIRPNDGDGIENHLRYRDSMGKFLRDHGFHENSEGGFSKPERINLLYLMENIEEVESYRRWFAEKKGEAALRRHNNPNQVRRAFDRWRNGDEPKKKPTGLRLSVAQLQERVDELEKEKERLEQALSEEDWQASVQSVVNTQHATQIAKAIFDTHDITHALELTDALVGVTELNPDPV